MTILHSLINPIAGLLDKFIQDKDQSNVLAHQIATMAERHAQELAKGQLEVNKVEAAHKNMFVAGWRPAVGWICAIGMAGNFILIPMANFLLALFQSEITIPLIALSEMMPVLMGMLGLGAMRTVEKAKGVQREK
ncbi:MAG: 3TM-type holin [Flavobacteriaceae bacterium]|nr:3TM-type holin [Flavobacteriaceae bacterium]